MSLRIVIAFLIVSLAVAAPDTNSTAAATAAFAAAWRKSDYKTNKPTIGILAQACHDCPGRSYIAAGFVKWVESAGARAVPIRFYSSEAELKRLFNSVNGIIFPGGLTDLYMDDPYVIAAQKLWTWARESNDNGDVFPIWGTCLGFQLLHILESDVSFTELLVDTDAVAQPSTLQFTDAGKQSYMFGSMDEDLVTKLGDSSQNIALQNHMFGLPPQHYDDYPVLRKNFDVLTTSVDRQGVEYVSSAEHRHYPFLATQWHPEKPPFEFGMQEVPHTLDAIRVSQHLANQLVDAARKSSHSFASPEEELEDLINNYKIWFTLKDSLMEPSYDGPDSCYFLDPEDEPPHGPDDATATAKMKSNFNSNKGAMSSGSALSMRGRRWLTAA